MASSNENNLRNKRCRRMLDMIGNSNDSQKTSLSIPENELAQVNKDLSPVEHAARKSSLRKKKIRDQSSIPKENATSDEDFSPDVSEYIPSRSPSPDSSPESKLHPRKYFKNSSLQNMMSPTISANSSLTKYTPKKSQKFHNVNFVASPSILYAIHDSELPEIFNIESFLRNFEQSQNDSNGIIQQLLDCNGDGGRDSCLAAEGVSGRIDIILAPQSNETTQLEKIYIPTQILAQSSTSKVTHQTHLSDKQHGEVNNNCRNLQEAVGQNTLPLQWQPETTRESEEPEPVTLTEYDHRLDECQIYSEERPMSFQILSHGVISQEVDERSFQLFSLQPETARELGSVLELATAREHHELHEHQLSSADNPASELAPEISANNSIPTQLDVINGENRTLDEENLNNRSRKRIRNEKDWIDKINKRLKNAGQPYMSARSKKAREKKQIGEVCTCKRQCSEKIDEDTRQKIFKLYWSLGDHEKQWNYILRYTSSNSIKKMQLIRNKNRTQTIIYKLPCNLDLAEETVIVCKSMFLGTLGITEKVVYTALEKRNSTLTDLRGTHLNRPKRMSEDTQRSIIDHIRSFPVVESHYTRKDSTRLYLNETLNQSKMYRLYKEWFTSQPDYQVIKMASKSQYELIFKTRFNYSFFCPKKDMCEQCMIYYNADTERKAQLQENFEKHREEKETVRKMKDLEKTTFDKSTETVACFDLEKVLHIPQSEVSCFYYKRKYAVYNFTIYNILTKQGYCFVWHHQIAKRGAIDIASCLYHYIKQEAEQGKHTISLYSDSCTGQNRNRIVFAMYQFASRKFAVNITHRFFVKGHSQSEGDTMHSCIERAKKHHTIYTPDQMYCIITNAKVTGEKFQIKEMQQSDFYDFKKLVSDRTKNWLHDDNSEKVYWSKIREIKIDSSTPDKIYYRNSLEDEYKTMTTNRQVSRRRRNNNTSENVFSLQPAYDQLISVPRPLYNDLISLCDSEAIPVQYQGFYRQLVPQNEPLGATTNSDSDSESLEENV